jgi:hypothetical protein
VRAVSQAFLDTLTGSHKMFSRAVVCTSFQDGISPTGYEIPIVDGEVRTDASADIRSSLTLSTAGDVGSWPHEHDDLLAPYGNEIWVERGLDFGNGVREIVGLGYHRIDTTSQARGPDGEIIVTASDRMSGIIDARLVQPIQFASGGTLANAFDVLVHEVYPDAEIVYDFDAEDSNFTTSHIAEEDRYGFLNDLARSRGKIMYWDYTGKLRVESPPDPTVPVYQVASGRGGVLVELSRSLTRQGVYNAVVVNGETPTDKPPVQAIVYDNNPLSPTYWNGPFGHVPRFYYSSFITTNSAANAAGQSLLQQAIGLPYNIDFQMIVNPALEPYDPIRITSPDRTDIHVIDSITIPLTATRSMSGSTRKLITFDPSTPTI